MTLARVQAAKPSGGRRLGVLWVVSAIVAVTLVATATPAYAHHAVLSGDATCNEDGSWSVAWSAGNSQTIEGRYMLVRSVAVTDGWLEGIVANGSYEGVVDASHPDASEGGGTVIPPDGTTVQFSTPNLPNSLASVTLTMTGYWNYPDGDGFEIITDYSQPLTVARPDPCVDSRPGHITVVKSTTGETAPPGPFTFLVNENGTTITSMTVPANGTATSGDLPPGTYTLVEVDGAPGVTIVPNPVTVLPDTTVTVTATNEYPSVHGEPPAVQLPAPPPLRPEAAPPPAQPPSPVLATGRFTG